MRRSHQLLLTGLIVLLSPLPAVVAAAAEATSVAAPSKAYELHRQGEREFANRHDASSNQ
jgi:hypothetical protein